MAAPAICFAFQRRFDRLLVRNRPARGVDEIRGRFHQRQFGRADQAAGAVGQLHMDGDEIGLLEQFFFGHQRGAGFLGFFGGEVLAPGDHLHVERVADARDALPELAQADDAERLAVKVDAQCRLPDRAVFQPRVLDAHLAGKLQHQAEGQFRRRRPERLGAAHRDAAQLSGGDVDGRVAHAAGDDQFEIGQSVDHVLAEQCALAHQAHHRAIFERGDHLVGSAQRLGEDLEIHVLGHAATSRPASATRSGNRREWHLAGSWRAVPLMAAGVKRRALKRESPQPEGCDKVGC